MIPLINQTSINNFVSKSLGLVLKEVSKPLNQIIQNRVLEFITETADKCSYIRTFLHKDNIPFDQVYFPLKIKRRDELIDTSSIESLFKDSNKDKKEKHNRIIIEGQGGSGKTTFIKFIYMNSVKTNYKIPVLINLRDFNLAMSHEEKAKSNLPGNLFFHTVAFYMLFNKISLDEKILVSMFDSGKFLFILDGYDEINYDIKDNLLKGMGDFITRFSNNDYIITTRPYTDAHNLPNFSYYELCGLRTSEIAPFIYKQLFNNKDLATRITETLKEPSSSAYIPLLQNPLFLILFLNSFESYPVLPPKKSTFYWQVFDALYEKHETFSKGGHRRIKLSNLNREEFETVLNKFSFVSYFQNKFDFSEMYMETTLREIKKIFDKVFEISNFIEDLKVTLSILIEDGSVLSFVHRTLQEYFAARFLNDLNEKDKNSFFEALATRELHGTNHSFLVELISELYPNEYRKYYLTAYIKMFFERYDAIFSNSKSSSDPYHTINTAYKNMINLISHASDIQEIFSVFINKYAASQNYDHRSKILIKAKGTEEVKNGKQMLLLHRHKEELYKTIDSFINNLSAKNKPFIEYALNQKSQ